MHLIFIYGPPAVGKLTVAKELAKILELPLVDNHSVVTPIARVFGWRHPEQRRLGDLFRFELFEAAAKEGLSLITTFGGGGTYYDPFVQKTKELVEGNGGSVIFVRLTAPKETLLERVSDQSRVDKFTVSEREKLLSLFERTPDVFESVFADNLIEIDTSEHTPVESAQLIAQALAERADV